MPQAHKIVAEMLDMNPVVPERSLESLTLLVKMNNLKVVDEKIQTKFTDIRDRQNQVAQLYAAIKAINTETTEAGGFEFSSNEELKEKLIRAKALGVDIKDGKFSYNKEERDRLLENIRMTVDELNVDNDMEIQEVTRLYNFRNEAILFAKNIMKTLHDIKQTLGRAVRGG